MDTQNSRTHLKNPINSENSTWMLDLSVLTTQHPPAGGLAKRNSKIQRADAVCSRESF
jgi:hypothetical protein